MYKDMRLSKYVRNASVQNAAILKVGSKKYCVCTTLGSVDGLLLKSWLPCYVLLALFEKGQLGKKWIRSREKSSLQVGLALHCRNKRV